MRVDCMASSDKHPAIDSQIKMACFNECKSSGAITVEGAVISESAYSFHLRIINRLEHPLAPVLSLQSTRSAPHLFDVRPHELSSTSRSRYGGLPSFCRLEHSTLPRAR